jgi:hypothetical protein
METSSIYLAWQHIHDPVSSIREQRAIGAVETILVTLGSLM